MTAGSLLLTIDQAAERLSVSVRFVRRLVAERRVPYFKIGKFIRFDQDELDSWIRSQRVGLHSTSRLIRPLPPPQPHD